MMISTKGRYAIRVLLDLAEQKSDGPTTLDAIANRQNLSKKYLESIVKLLVSGNIVKGTSGKGGGYHLTRQPEEYTILEILKLTESSMSSVACLEDGAEACPNKDKCKTISMWSGFDKLTKDYFSKITLRDLLC
ncbi:MAG: Rrf2 family transcriptional regulator [Saccharofermentans sp.]|nr:Rrf2 family transcriptional regulator [Saccharofermentans sp.]